MCSSSVNQDSNEPPTAFTSTRWHSYTSTMSVNSRCRTPRGAKHEHAMLGVGEDDASETNSGLWAAVTGGRLRRPSQVMHRSRQCCPDHEKGMNALVVNIEDTRAVQWKCRRRNTRCVSVGPWVGRIHDGQSAWSWFTSRPGYGRHKHARLYFQWNLEYIWRVSNSLNFIQCLNLKFY
jgi:hypothetical protein